MGRTALVIVLGFSITLLFMGHNLSRVTTTSFENYINFYCVRVAENVASAGANLAAQSVYRNPAWRAGFSNIPFSGGTVSVKIADLPYGKLELVSTGNYFNHTATVRVLMQPSTLSKFAYYSAVEAGVTWGTGDTIWGPFHTQQQLRVSGNPVFYGKATSKNGLFKSPATSEPKFYGGYQSGVSIPLPSDLSPLKTASILGGHYVSGLNVELTFNADGTVTVKEGIAPPVTLPLAVYAPNGAVFVENASVRVKGTLKGKITIAATGSSGLSKGNVYIDDDMVYSSHPLGGNCTDLLGLVAQNNVIVADNAANNNNVNIHAAVLSVSGGVMAEHHDTRGLAGFINLVGGDIQYQRGPVATFDGTPPVITSGFNRNYRYDERLLVDAPPYFPSTGMYEIVGWYE